MTIEIHNLRDKQPYLWKSDIRCDRSSPLGNPFHMETESQRDEVCDKYDVWIKNAIKNGNQAVKDELNRLFFLHNKHNMLRLFCWCAPKRCHCETIKQLLEDAL